MRTFATAFQWTTLRILGQSKIVSMTMFVPILGFLLIFNDTIIEYLKLSEIAFQTGQSKEALNRSTDDNVGRLRLIYIGLIIVGIASFIFKIRCPSEIIQHSQEYEFIRAELEIMTSERFNFTQDRIRNWNRPLSSSLKNRALASKEFKLSEELIQSRVLAGQMSLGYDDWLNRNRRAISEVLSILYAIQNQSRLKARFFIILFYSVGFLIIIYPSIVIFAQVFRVTFKSLL